MDSKNESQKKLANVKELAETPNLNSVPSNYAFFQSGSNTQSHVQISVPVIDLNILQFGTTEEQSAMITKLGKACEEWGFFTVVNHGVEGNLMKEMKNKVEEFFNLKTEEKQEVEGSNVLDPIRCGTSYAKEEKVNLWRDYLKVITHPRFHSPTKPSGFSEVLARFTEENWRVATTILRAIFASLGHHDAGATERALGLDEGHQVVVANYYPPCPRPDLAIGLPPHSDHGLLTLLIYNQVGGFQIWRNHQWVSVKSVPNSFLVNIGDHMEIISNGKFKSILHRAVVNAEKMRLSIATIHGPALDKVVAPLTADTPKYKPLVYREYLEYQQGKALVDKTGLDIVRVE